jgi:hypothetical protein
VWLGKPHPEQGQDGRRFAVVLRRRSRAARPMPAGRPLEPAGNGRPRWMTAHREAARRPWTEPGVQADSSVVPPLTCGYAVSWGGSPHRVRNSGENRADGRPCPVFGFGPQVTAGIQRLLTSRRRMQLSPDGENSLDRKSVTVQRNPVTATRGVRSLRRGVAAAGVVNQPSPGGNCDGLAATVGFV